MNGCVGVPSAADYKSDLKPIWCPACGDFGVVQAIYRALAAIGRPVDMVQVFRNSDALLEVAREAIAIHAKVLWAQLGVRNDEAARLAEDAGMKVVMNRCPKIELFRPFWKPRLNQAI